MSRVIADFVSRRSAPARASAKSRHPAFLFLTKPWLLALLVGWALAWGVPPGRAGEFGRASFKVVFPEGKIGRREPLVVSAAGQDVLFVWYSGKDEIRIGFYHLGSGGPVSQPVRIVPGREYDLELNLGCFYPPLGHPAFAGWPAPGAKALRQKLVVLLDEALVLNTTAAFYPTLPEDIHFGENPGPYVAPGKFSGTLSGFRRQGMPLSLDRLAPAGTGPLRFTVRFPEFQAVHSEPLVSTGSGGAGDLLYVAYVGPGRIRFGHDSWGAGSIETVDVSYKPGAAHTVELEMPAFTPQPAGTTRGRLILRFNGAVLLADDRQYHPSTPDRLRFGFNAVDSSAAGPEFTGEISDVERASISIAPPEKFQLEPGPVHLLLHFPTDATGHYEPLLVTGRTSAADVIYVHYVDATHVRFGYDHWSKGGPVSEPILVDYALVQGVDIQLGSLFPPEDDAAWQALPAAARAAALSTVLVKLNGATVLTHQERAYPTKPDEILTGLNAISATTCERRFTGRILHQERSGLTPLTP